MDGEVDVGVDGGGVMYETTMGMLWAREEWENGKVGGERRKDDGGVKRHFWIYFGKNGSERVEFYLCINLNLKSNFIILTHTNLFSQSLINSDPFPRTKMHL